MKKIFNKIRLRRFDKETKSAFILSYNKSSLAYLRLSIIIMTVVSSVLYGWLDYYLMPENYKTAWFIRYVLWFIALGTILYLSYKPVILKNYDIIIGFLVFYLGTGIIFMIANSSKSEYSYTTYYIGIAVVMTFAVMLRLRLKATLTVLSLLLITYTIYVVVFQKLESILIFNNLVFLASFYTALGITAYIIESYARDNFHQKLIILHEREKIEQIHRHLSESIKYAQTIQQANLPLKSEIEKHLNYFLIYKPKDIVSGDFYWFAELPQKNEILIAEADCTGHGVPGAFMSFIGTTLLNEIVNYKKITDPSTILTELDILVKKALKQEQTDNPDGMDISICKYKKLENGQTKIIFSGAKQDLHYYKKSENQIKTLKGDRKDIGGMLKRLSDKNRFSNKEITLETGDMIYLMSDGFIDQNNTKRRKIGTIRLTKILTTIAESELEAQKKHLENFLEKWQKEEKQRDDVTIIGIKIP